MSASGRRRAAAAGSERERPPVATRILVTCEHGGHRVPTAYQALFRGSRDALRSHRGWDPGALPMARELAHALGAPLRSATNTRLLVDLNRSPRNPAVFSEVTRRLTPEERRRLLEHHHAPHRAAVEEDVEHALEKVGRVLHLAVHTFTPFRNGVLRKTDVGLLYDPARAAERAVAAAWVSALRRRLPGASIRRNHPYRGATDGLTTWLRRVHPPERYLGIEIEVSQGLLDGRGRVPTRTVAALAEGVIGSLAELR